MFFAIKYQKKSRRASAATSCFPAGEYTGAISVYSMDGMISDAEGDDGQRETACSIDWRHQDIKTLSTLLDQAYIQFGSTPRIKRERRANIESTSHPAHENSQENIPKGIPKNWIKQEYYSRLTIVEKIGLNLKDDVDLQPAIAFLQTSLARPNNQAPIASGSR